VQRIPETFLSMTEYMNSFMDPLIEEAHTDFLSNMTAVRRAPVCNIHSVEESKKFKLPKDLFYEIKFNAAEDTKKDIGSYEPEVGDLIALTDFRPKSIDDLDRPTRFYLIAYVYGTKAESSGKLQILASKRIRTEPNMQRNMRETFLGWKRETFPTNKKETILAVYLMNMTTIVRMWRAVNSDLEGGNRNILNKVVQNNAADEENCTTCFSKGKCSPSNSGERLRIDSCDDLRDVFLDYRVNVLRKCFTSSSGWKECLEVVIRFLENPKLEYNIYFEERKKKNVEVEDELKQEESTSNPVKEDDGTMTFEEFVKKKNVEVEDELKQEESTSNPAKEDDHTMTFEEFVKKKFSLIRKSLKCCMIDLCTHLPTSLLPLEVVKDMIRALKLLKSLQTLLCNLSTVANEGLEHVLNDFEDIGSSVGCSSKLSITVKECLRVIFNNDFKESIHRVRNSEICKEVLYVLQKLLSGWRQPQEERDPIVHDGPSSQLLEMSFVVPRRWPVDSSSCSEPDTVLSLSKDLSSVSLSDKPETSTAIYRNNFKSNMKNKSEDVEFKQRWLDD
ncbi:hypothetical protein CFP56_012621, partial [Quercus suber]